MPESTCKTISDFVLCVFATWWAFRQPDILRNHFSVKVGVQHCEAIRLRVIQRMHNRVVLDPALSHLESGVTSQLEACKGEICDRACIVISRMEAKPHSYPHSSNVLPSRSSFPPSMIFGDCQPLMVHAPDSSMTAGICPIRRRRDSTLSSAGFRVTNRAYCQHSQLNDIKAGAATIRTAYWEVHLVPPSNHRAKQPRLSSR